MIGLVGALLLGSAQAADADAVLSINTGMRPLALPVLSSALGGGFRAGLVLGPVTPFAGGSITSARVSPRGDFDPEPTYVHSATVQAGARLRVVELEHAETFLLVGGLLSSVGGRTVWDANNGRGSGLKLALGPGVFLGGGADAFVSRRVSLGIEAGGAFTAGSLRVGGTDGKRFEERPVGEGGMLFTYTSLGFTVWVGGES